MRETGELRNVLLECSNVHNNKDDSPQTFQEPFVSPSYTCSWQIRFFPFLNLSHSQDRCLTYVNISYSSHLFFVYYFFHFPCTTTFLPWHERTPEKHFLREETATHDPRKTLGRSSGNADRPFSFILMCPPALHQVTNKYLHFPSHSIYVN